MKIIDLIIASVNDNLSSQKITINVDNDAKALLVEKGYDPKLGARPMRRIVQKTVENIIAKRVLAGDVSSGAEIQISKQDIIDQLEK
jgi:ATP-dependent Clp protease ATP-binding subunit ClpA